MRPHPGLRTLATSRESSWRRPVLVGSGLNAELLPLKRPPSLGKKSRGLDFPRVLTSRTTIKPFFFCVSAALSVTVVPSKAPHFPGHSLYHRARLVLRHHLERPIVSHTGVSISNCANRVRQTLSSAPRPYHLKIDSGQSQAPRLRPRRYCQGLHVLSELLVPQHGRSVDIDGHPGGPQQ